MRYFVELSYNGKAYHGWQKQPNARTVQEVLEKAMSTLLRAPIELVGAGRTDAGVHAKQMFAHFDAESIGEIPGLVHHLNAFLPADIAIQRIFEVPEDAHARFDALFRTYEYWVVQHKDPFYLDSAHYIRHSLDIDTMNGAAELLLTHADFQCFSKAHTDVKTYVCDVRQAFWEQRTDKLVFTITADRFLRNMVRAIVGTLLEVGINKWTKADVNTILKSGDRSKAGASVPAKGLYLSAIGYPMAILKAHGKGFGTSI